MSARQSTPLAPRVRADLEWTNHQSARWLARDPLTANFYCFNDIERQAVALMTGRRNVLDILETLRRSFPAAQLDQAWLGSLLSRLQVHHLLVPASRAETSRLVRSRSDFRRRSFWQPLLSPLAIRIPLLNPMRLLEPMRPLALVLFHPLMVWLWLLVGGCMGLLVLRELFSSNWSHVFDVTAIQGDRWLLLFVCYLGAKSLHELGHGLACIRNGAACNEIGLMLLCMAPCLYCDTTDSWKLPNKWQRAQIAAAGMYVEWILATLAASVWLLTQVGTVHYVAASVMVVCSLGTLLINSNPLLKYDGYYILSDLWGVPNLSDQGREALRAYAARALAGRPINPAQFDASPLALALYAMVSSIYRTFILGAIIWICWTVLLPLGLGLVAILLTGLLLCGLVLSQYRGLRSFVGENLRSGGFRPLRWAVAVAALLFALIAAGVYPLPSVMRARAVTDFEDKQPLFANQTAELTAAAETNTYLPGGTLVLEFEAPESQLELCEVRGRLALLAEELKQLQLRSAVDPVTAYNIPAKSEELKELQGRERLLKVEIDALRHTAPHSGYLLAEPRPMPPAITAPRDDRFGPQPLDPSFLGSTWDRSTLVGWFSGKEQMVLSAIVPEGDVKRLQVGQTGLIQWDSELDYVARGRITRIAPAPIEQTPAELVGDPALVSERNEHGEFLPEQPHYEVMLQVMQAPQRLRGAPATVQFEMPAQTLWQRLRELVRQNLKPLS